MAINYPYNPSQLNENETLYEELIKIRKFLDKNPIYKVYNYDGNFENQSTDYKLEFVIIDDIEALTVHDVVVFNNSFFAVVESINKDTFTFRVDNAHNFGFDIEGAGTNVFIDGIKVDRLEFKADPQNQIDNLILSIAENVKGIAHLNEIKQDKLAQVDLDNIASINQMKDDINSKQDQLSVQQLQAIGEVDAVKSIALDNQTNKASKIEVNSLSMCPSDTIETIYDYASITDLPPVYKATHNGYVQVLIRFNNGECEALSLHVGNLAYIGRVGYLPNERHGDINIASPIKKGQLVKWYIEEPLRPKITKLRLQFIPSVEV